MKYIIGFVVGVLVYHYYPTETKQLATGAGAIVHEGAKKATEITQPITNGI